MESCLHEPRNHQRNPRRPGRPRPAGEQRSAGPELSISLSGRANSARRVFIAFANTAGRAGAPPLRGSWRATPLFWRGRVELLGRDFVRREDLLSGLLLARFLVAQALKLRKGLLLFGLVTQHSLHLRKPVPSDLVFSIERDRLLQVRQSQVRLLQRHENCGQPQLSFFKIGMVLHSQLKEFLCFVELARIAMNLTQLVSGVGIARIDFQFLVEFLDWRQPVSSGTLLCRERASRVRPIR